jgi:hypothetical protein
VHPTHDPSESRQSVIAREGTDHPIKIRGLLRAGIDVKFTFIANNAHWFLSLADAREKLKGWRKY